MRKDRFTDEALRNAAALAELKYSESEADQLRFSETYDFARCQRSDGSFYPIPDGKKCRKGAEASPIDPGAKRLLQGQKPVVEAASKSPKKPKTDFRKEIEAGAKIRRERDAAIEKLQGRQMRLRKAYAKASQDAAAAIRAKDSKRAEKAKARVEKIGEALDSASDMMRKYTGNRGNTAGRKKRADGSFYGIPDGKQYGFSEEAYEAFLEGMAERYDFGNRCRRADGSFYGTAGQCKTGSTAAPKKKSEKWCAQYRPWAPLGMQHVVVPCRALGYK